VEASLKKSKKENFMCLERIERLQRNSAIELKENSSKEVSDYKFGKKSIVKLRVIHRVPILC